MYDDQTEEETTQHTCIERECGQTFEMTASESQWFINRDWDQPKRCKPCRQRRQNEKEQKNLE